MEKNTFYKDMKIYPCFKPIKYTIIYDCNYPDGSGLGKVSSTKHVYNTPAKLAAGTKCKKKDIHLADGIDYQMEQAKILM